MKLDIVTLEVIRNALPAVANEMAADLQRTSYNMMIYEVRDYCTALLNTKGELISQNVGGVSHFVADLGVLVTDGMALAPANPTFLQARDAILQDRYRPSIADHDHR